ncbi:MAG: DNA-directed RNA polymerase subunit omega [Clostridiales bacterium]|nr:DNA-directed RNA polymerase subunit omega [Clostridiales bacterium]
MPLNQPPISELVKKAECRYTLVVESSKRARELVAGAQPLVDPKDRKPVAIAVDEINRGLLTFHRNLEDEEE